MILLTVKCNCLLIFQSVYLYTFLLSRWISRMIWYFTLIGGGDDSCNRICAILYENLSYQWQSYYGKQN